MTRRLVLALALVGAGCSSPAPPHARRPPFTSTTPPAPRTALPADPSTTAATVPHRAVEASTVSTTAPAPESPPVPAGGVDNHGRASWYARGTRTANGERFDPDGLSFAHRTMAFGSLVRFCHAGRCVVARCTDRGPAEWTQREFDLSRGAFAAIAPLGAGVVDVTWEAA